MATLRGIDISKYQGAPGADWFRRISHEGWKVAVIGSWHGLDANRFCEQNLREAKQAGMHVATYTALNGRPGRVAVDEARRACGSMWDDLAFVALDCEVDGITAAVINEALQFCWRQGKKACIYTANWWWGGRFGNPTDWRNIPLWTADYDQDPKLDFPLAYGGWTASKVIGKQWAGTTPLHGVDVDKNTFAEEFVKEATMPEPTCEQKATVARLFLQAARQALDGRELTEGVKAQIKFLLG